MLTQPQINAIAAVITATPALAPAVEIRDDNAIAAFFNSVDVGDANNTVWRTSVPVDDVTNAITWASLTPSDVADTTQIFLNRAMVCELKMMLLQNLLIGRQSINTSKQNIRQAFSDALTGIPSGAGGANQNAGNAAVTAIFKRLGTRIESLFGTGTGTNGSPKTMTYEGIVSPNDIGSCY